MVIKNRQALKALDRKNNERRNKVFNGVVPKFNNDGLRPLTSFFDEVVV